MMIVDAQIHLWEKGTPSAHHRQEPYSMDQALAGMDEAGVDRAVIHPVMWDPDSNELAVEAARAHPDRFAILGWFYLDRPESRALIDTWKSRPGMLGLRFYFNEPHMQSWPTDGTLDRIWQYFSTNGFYKIPIGNSTFDMPSVDDLRGGMKNFPDRASVEKLRYYGIRTVVLHTVTYKELPPEHGLVIPEPPNPVAAASKPVAGLGVSRRQVGSIVIYQIGPGPKSLHGKD